MRHLCGFLWRFYAFRRVIVWMACEGIAGKWLGRNTPLLEALRVRMVEVGRLDLAGEAAGLQREVERS